MDFKFFICLELSQVVLHNFSIRFAMSTKLISGPFRFKTVYRTVTTVGFGQFHCFKVWQICGTIYLWNWSFTFISENSLTPASTIRLPYFLIWSRKVWSNWALQILSWSLTSVSEDPTSADNAGRQPLKKPSLEVDDFDYDAPVEKDELTAYRNYVVPPGSYADILSWWTQCGHLPRHGSPSKEHFVHHGHKCSIGTELQPCQEQHWKAHRSTAFCCWTVLCGDHNKQNTFFILDIIQFICISCAWTLICFIPVINYIPRYDIFNYYQILHNIFQFDIPYLYDANFVTKTAASGQAPAPQAGPSSPKLIKFHGW